MTPYYEAGGITIYHADCRDVLPALVAVDHVITDPPYARDVYVRLGVPNSHPARAGAPANLGRTGIGAFGPAKAGNGARIRRLAAGEIGCIDEMIEPVGAEIARLVRRWALVFSDVETTHRWRAALEGAGMRYVRTGAWVKPDPMPQFSGDRPAVGFEACTIAHAPGPMRWHGGGRPAVWTYNTVKGERYGHPCPKPLPLMRELLALFSDEGDTILDPYMGVGTTLRAAKDLGRRAIGVEIDERYCEAAARRMAQEVLV